MKKRVLIISENCVSSAGSKNGSGGSTFCMLVAQKEYIVDFLYFTKRDPESEKELQPYCNRIINYNIDCKLYKSPLQSILLRSPKIVINFDRNILKTAIQSLPNYEIVVCAGISVIGVIDYIKGQERNIAFLIDSMPMYYERRRPYESRIKGVYNYLQRKFLVDVENKYLPDFDKFVFVSEVDSEYEKKLHSNYQEKMSFVNNGVFLNDIICANQLPNIEESIVFSGIMSYQPNEDAAIFLAEEVFPLVKKQKPNCKLYIVGKNPSKKVKSYENDSIIVTGMVDSVYSYIKSATVYVSPLRYGSGMKNKILEAMACKSAIIASPVSIDGIKELQNGINISVIYGDCKEWAEEIINLISNEELRSKYMERCFEIVTNNYTWDGAFEKMVK